MHRRSRVVIDTNIWLSYLLGGLAFKQLQKILLNKRITILMSIPLKNEITTVINRPKFLKCFSQHQLDDFYYIMNYRTTLVNTTSEIEVCRDKTDNFLFALCKDGKADYLVSGDKDILSVGEFYGTKLISLKKFVS